MTWRGLSLNAKVALAVAAAFAVIMVAFLAVLLPFQQGQRRRFLDRDERLLATLREKHERDLIYDLLSENRESLAVDLADLARQPGILWVAVDAKGLSLAGTSDPDTMRRLLGQTAGGEGTRPALMIGEGGRAALVGDGGSAQPVDRAIPADAVPSLRTQGASFQEIDWPGGSALHHQADLKAADDVFGRLHLVYSLADLRRTEAQTRTIAYALAGTTFVVLLLLLNVLLSRVVVQPIHAVAQGMTRARGGDLSVRLPVTAGDEIGSMAASFNDMVSQLGESKKAIEDYSRGLEMKVAERTHDVRVSEERLRNLSRYLETVIAHAATGVVSLDGDGRIATFNRRAAEILGSPGGDIVGRTLDEALTAADARRLLEVVEAARRQGSPAKAQLTLRFPEGRRTVAVVASVLPDASGRQQGAVVVMDDLTQVIASQRLEAWKEAVERVIHEIKNPLTPIGLATETMRTAFAEDRERFDALFPSASLMVLNSVRDLRTLISEFTRFYRMPKMALKPHDVNELVADALAPYVGSDVEGCTVRLELGEGLPSVDADAEQIRRVLLNVVTNGIDAMIGAPGELLVTTAASGHEAVISVEDRGTGVEDVERLFEPYYTTKAKGTGLGLVISKQIVEEHGGTLRITSALGEGTTVRISLPAGGQTPRS